MKKVLIIWIAFLVLGSVRGQEIEYIQKGNRVLKVEVISDIKFQNIDPDIFSEEEIKRMKKGGIVNIISEKKINLVNLLPLKTESYQTVSSYAIEEGVVEKIKEEEEFSPIKKLWWMSILWIYIPFVLVFVTASCVYKNDNRNRGSFIIFSVLTTIAVAITIILGWVINPGLLVFAFGLFIGGILGASGGENIGIIAGAFTGAISGMVSSVIEGFPVILWQYVLIYIGICGISLLYQEMIIFLKKRRLSKKLANIRKAADEKI